MAGTIETSVYNGGLLSVCLNNNIGHPAAGDIRHCFFNILARRIHNVIGAHLFCGIQPVIKRIGRDDGFRAEISHKCGEKQPDGTLSHYHDIFAARPVDAKRAMRHSAEKLRHEKDIHIAISGKLLKAHRIGDMVLLVRIERRRIIHDTLARFEFIAFGHIHDAHALMTGVSGRKRIA